MQDAAPTDTGQPHRVETSESTAETIEIKDIENDIPMLIH